MKIFQTAFGGGVSLIQGCLKWVLGKLSIDVRLPTYLEPQVAIARGSNPPRWGYIYHPVPRPTLKRPCAILPGLVGRVTNRENFPTAFSGGVSLGRVCLTWMPVKASVPVTQPTLLELQGHSLQALTLLGRTQYIS